MSSSTGDSVPSLESIAIAVLRNFTHRIGYVGMIPDELIRAVLEQAPREQLERIQRENPDVRNEEMFSVSVSLFLLPVGRVWRRWFCFYLSFLFLSPLKYHNCFSCNEHCFRGLGEESVVEEGAR